MNDEKPNTYTILKYQIVVPEYSSYQQLGKKSPKPLKRIPSKSVHLFDTSSNLRKLPNNLKWH